MPEYLAPGVYVEEIDTGPKPIEGVSTSTTGLVGMTERGPVAVPVLVTSVGEYGRWFGGLLDRDDFQDPADARRAHCWLPHAVEGFFTNGGKRAYVVRVAPEEANRAHRDMFDRGAVGGGASLLLRTAREGSGTAATAPLFVLDAAGIAVGETVRIGDGSSAEYVPVATAPAASTAHLALDAPIRRAHATGATIHTYARSAVPGLTPPHTVNAAASAGNTTIEVLSAVDDLTTIATPWLAEFAGEGQAEIALVTGASKPGPNRYLLQLGQPLGDSFAVGASVLPLQVAGAPVVRTLTADASGGDLFLFASAGATAPDDIVDIEPASATERELRSAGAAARLTLAQPLADALPARGEIAEVVLADDAAVPAATLTQAAGVGARTLSLSGRDGLAVGTVLRIGVAPAESFATILSIAGARTAAPDPGAVTLSAPLTRAYPATTTVVQAQATPTYPAVPAAPAAALRASPTLLDVAANGTELVVPWSQGWAAGDFARITAADGSSTYHRVDAAPVAIAPDTVELSAPLARTHAAGQAIVERAPLFTVEALDVGAWGRRLRISVEDEDPGLVARAEVISVAPPTQLRLTTLTGVEPGSYLELIDPATGAVVDAPTPLKVHSVDRATATIRTDVSLSAAQISAIGTAVTPIRVRSREFRLTVRLYRRPDPAVPSRNEQVIQTEIFRNLSMDHRHSRYIERVIGATDGPERFSDRRPEGDSWLIRVKDFATTDAAREAPRLGPETLIDLMPGGRTRAARHPLDHDGDDSVVTMNDLLYLGHDDPEPRNRTGLAALRSVQQISLLAIPGQGTTQVQGGLIAACEDSRYRFCVLDPRTPGDTLADVQAQRQAFDTKYAALYYPWLTIPDPMPDNLASIAQFPVPPSGHVLGLFARVDDERGVHKAPANEVVRGITGITRSLEKGEHDLLNPSPVNINVIRDFRPTGRSIRVWGTRCITSDTEHKYVPVRRLLIFVEQSIDIGLQWVVFEPNAEPLWARVTSSISNFLTDVWRSGALEGTKVEQAFFVRCDRTTMTQSDIDNGRLIILTGIAPVKPAEFVIIRMSLMTAVNET